MIVISLKQRAGGGCIVRVAVWQGSGKGGKDGKGGKGTRARLPMWLIVVLGGTVAVVWPSLWRKLDPNLPKIHWNNLSEGRPGNY